MAAGDLFGRVYKLTIDTYEVSELACSFVVKKTLKPEPNTIALRVYNLPPLVRGELQKQRKDGIPVRLEAGYEGTGLSLIYFGETRSAWSYLDGSDVVTELAAGDGEKAMKQRVHVPLGPRTPPDVALDGIVRALGVKAGNVAAARQALRLRGKALFPAGGALVGSAARELSDFCRAAGLEWSVQDGALQILERGRTTPESAFLLSSATGLVGSPSAGNQGIVNAQTKLLPDLRPGRLVVFEATEVRGAYRVEEVEYEGDTHGESWNAKIACKKW